MAITNVTPIKADLNKFKAVTLTTAETPTDGFVIDCKRYADEKITVFAVNTGSATKKITVKKPTTGSYAAAPADEELSLETGAYAVLRFESARVGNNDGTVVIVPESADVKIAVIG